MSETPNEWRIIRRLGRGSTTALAERTTRQGELAVLKTLNLAMLDDWKSVELFEREAATLQHLTHARIPKLLSSYSDRAGKRFVMVQTYFDAPPLTTLVNQEWTADRMIELARSVLEILSYLHSLSPPVVHRDIEPSNILFDHVGRAFLVDFGGVQRLVASQIGGSTVVGTSGYMPPEQFVGQASPESDLYGLGKVLIHLATGLDVSKLPIEGLRVRWAGLSRSPLSKEFIAFINRLTDPVAAARPRNGAAALEELETMVENQSRAIGRPIASDVLMKRSPDSIEIRMPRRPFSYTWGATWAGVSVFIASAFFVLENGRMATASAIVAVVCLALTAIDWVNRTGSVIEVDKDTIDVRSMFRSKKIDTRDLVKVTPGFGATPETLSLTTQHGTVTIGHGLSKREQEWIAAEIERFVGLI